METLSDGGIKIRTAAADSTGQIAADLTNKQGVALSGHFTNASFVVVFFHRLMAKSH